MVGFMAVGVNGLSQAYLSRFAESISGPGAFCSGAGLSGDHACCPIQGMNRSFPLKLRFRLLTFSPKIEVRDAQGREVLFVKQRSFRLREKIELHEDSSRAVSLGSIEADRILDWNARYLMRDATGAEVGAVGRQGMRSLWSAHYEVFAPGQNQTEFSIREQNSMAKLLDALLDSIPLVGLLSNFLFHPRYVACDASGRAVMRLTKQAALFEGCFKLDLLEALPEDQEQRLILAFLMLALLERSRG
jgi:hypothetical protein